MQVVRIFSFITALMITVACGTIAASPVVEADPTPVPVDEALIERGIEIYRANYCGYCHTLTDANTRGTFGPVHDNVGAMAEEHITLSRYQGKATTAAEYIRESLLDPNIFHTPGFEATNHHMPAYTHLPEEDIDALVYLLLHQREASE